MPRRYRRSRRFKRRRLNRRRGRTATKRYVRKAVDRVSEKKFVEFTWTPVSAGSVAGIGTTPIGIEVTTLSVGALDTQRIGDQIMGRSIRIRGTINSPLTVPDSYNFIRLICFQWQRSPDTSPTSAGVGCFQNDTFDILAMYSHDKRYNYRILMDKVFKVVPGATVPAVFFKKLIRLKRRSRRIQYNAGQASAFNGGSNPIGLLVVSDSALENHPIVKMEVKFNYKDQ